MLQLLGLIKVSWSANAYLYLYAVVNWEIAWGTACIYLSLWRLHPHLMFRSTSSSNVSCSGGSDTLSLTSVSFAQSKLQIDVLCVWACCPSSVRADWYCWVSFRCWLGHAMCSLHVTGLFYFLFFFFTWLGNLEPKGVLVTESWEGLSCGAGFPLVLFG